MKERMLTKTPWVLANLLPTYLYMIVHCMTSEYYTYRHYMIHDIIMMIILRIALDIPEYVNISINARNVFKCSTRPSYRITRGCARILTRHNKVNKLLGRNMC